MDAAVRLPEKASDVIELALADLEKVEKDDRYVVEMCTWHRPLYNITQDARCAVCLAGAVMSMSLSSSIDRNISPSDAPDRYTSARLVALDEFRIGDVEYGLRALGVPTSNLPFGTMDVVPYDENPEQFKSDMRRMADHLRSWGY